MKALEDLEAAFAAATQGEWKVERNNQDQCTVVVLDGSLRTKVAVTHPTWICEEHGGTTFDNSLLIALMHNTLPALIECAEALEFFTSIYFEPHHRELARAALAKLENAK